MFQVTSLAFNNDNPFLRSTFSFYKYESYFVLQESSVPWRCVIGNLFSSVLGLLDFLGCIVHFLCLCSTYFSFLSSFFFFKYIYCFNFWPCYVALRISTLQPGIKLSPPAVEVRNLNHWTPRKVLILVFSHPSTSQAQPCLALRSDEINLSFLRRTLRVASPGALVCMAALVAKMVKNLPAMQETRVWSLDWEIPLEKGMAIHFSVLACRIPWTEEPGGLQSMGSQRIGCDWVTNAHTLVPSLWIEGVARGEQWVLSRAAEESFSALWFHWCNHCRSSSQEGTQSTCVVLYSSSWKKKSADFPKATRGWSPFSSLVAMDFFSSSSVKERGVQKLAPCVLALGLQDSLGITREIVLCVCCLLWPHQMNPRLQILFLWSIILMVS